LKRYLDKYQQARFNSLINQFDITLKINKISFKDLIDSLSVIELNQRVIVLWVVYIGNYPTYEETYLLSNYLQLSPKVTEKWLAQKRRNYKLLGLPNTYIRNEHSKIFYDVSETHKSPLSSGIQRIVRNVAHEISSEIEFITWTEKFGILSPLTQKQIYSLKNWENNKFDDIHARCKLILLAIGLYKKTRKLVASALPTFIVRILRALEVNLKDYIFWLLGLLKINFKKDAQLIFSVNSRYLVLELQSLDLRVLDRVYPILQSKMFHYSFLVHDTLPLRYPEFFTSSTVGNFVSYARNLRNSSQLFVMSESEKQYLVKFLESQDCATPTILKIDPPLFEIENKEFDGADQYARFLNKNILMVGSLEPRKNYVRTLKAIYKASLKLEDIKVKLVYPNKWLNDEIQFEIDKLSNSGIKLELLQSISDEELSSLYNQSSLLVFCSLAEGLGLPLLEARSAGLPAVTSNVGFMHELRNFGGVKNVDPHNIDEISTGIVEILSNYEMWLTLHRETQKKVGLKMKEYASQFLKSGLRN
jgi:glycosyltransferase involved in cell wall biosynthesis